MIQKYTDHRSEIKTGDIILYRGHTILSKGIQWLDKAYYNHAGIAYWIGERLFTMDANPEGVKMEAMSVRMAPYDDFCVIRVINYTIPDLRNACNNLMNRVEVDQTYGYLGCLRRIIYIKAGVNVEWINKKGLPVCSDIARDFEVDMGVVSAKQMVLPTPQDLLRYIDKDKCIVLWDDSPKEIPTTIAAVEAKSGNV